MLSTLLGEETWTDGLAAPLIFQANERGEPDARQGRGRRAEPIAAVEREFSLDFRVDSLAVPEVMGEAREHVGECQDLRELRRDVLGPQAAVGVEIPE